MGGMNLWPCSYKIKLIATKYEVKIAMLFHWSLKIRFHRCYELSVRLTGGLGNMCRSSNYSSSVYPRGTIDKVEGSANNLGYKNLAKFHPR